jgi:hypothetical protein
MAPAGKVTLAVAVVSVIVTVDWPLVPVAVSASVPSDLVELTTYAPDRVAGVVAAPAVSATAMGSATAASMDPAAKALTNRRGIRRWLFMVYLLHS